MGQLNRLVVNLAKCWSKAWLVNARDTGKQVVQGGGRSNVGGVVRLDGRINGNDGVRHRDRVMDKTQVLGN